MRLQNKVGATHNGQIALPISYTLTTKMHRDQRRRTGRINRHTWPLQPQEEGKPPGCGIATAPCRHMKIEFAQIAKHMRFIIAEPQTDEDTCTTAD